MFLKFCEVLSNWRSSLSQKVNFIPLDDCYTNKMAKDRQRGDLSTLVPSRSHYESSHMKLLKKQDFSASIDRYLREQNFISILSTNEHMSKFHFRLEFGVY